MFNEKEKAKFYAELLRNLGTALIAGAYISMAGGDSIAYPTIICVSGIITITAGAIMMEG